MGLYWYMKHVAPCKLTQVFQMGIVLVFFCWVLSRCPLHSGPEINAIEFSRCRHATWERQIITKYLKYTDDILHSLIISINCIIIPIGVGHYVTRSRSQNGQTEHLFLCNIHIMRDLDVNFFPWFAVCFSLKAGGTPYCISRLYTECPLYLLYMMPSQNFNL